MNLILLDRDQFESYVDDMNNQLKESGVRKRGLKAEAKERIYRVLSILLSANYSKMESGVVRYERNEDDNRNPYRLCDGTLIYETSLAEMPILLHTMAYRILLNPKTRKNIDEYNFLEKISLEGAELSKVQAMGLGTKYYYKFTAAVKKMIPNNPEWKEVDSDTSEFMMKYFVKKNRLEDQLYIQLIKMLTKFQFLLPKKDVFIDRHQEEYKDCKLHNRTPEELMLLNFRRMQNFNQYDVDQLICNSSSCEEKWAGRFYSPITSLSKYCRQYLIHTATGSHLVELDIQTCQYHMINCVLRQLLGDGCTGNLHTHLSTGKNVYEEIAKVMYKTSSPTKKEVGQAKKAAFERLFSGFENPDAPYNRKKNLPWTFKESYRAIKELYPDLITAVEKLKDMDPEGFENTLTWRDELDYQLADDPYYEYKVKSDNDHRKVSYCATCMEVKLMKNLWRRLNDAGIDYITMHDAVYVTPVKEHPAKSYFEQVLTDELGYTPVVRSELMDGKKK